MKIVHYLSEVTLAHGGVVRSVLDISKGLASRGHSVTLLCFDDTSVPPEWKLDPDSTSTRAHQGIPTAIRLGTPVHPKPFRKLRRRDTDVVLEYFQSADVIHLHGPWESINIQLSRMARRLGKPYVISIHGMLDDWSVIKSRWRKRAHFALWSGPMFRHAARILCTAEGERRQTAKWFGAAASRCEVLPLTFDMSSFDPLPGVEPARRAVPAARTDEPVVLFLSRLHPKKGIEILIDAAGALKDKHPFQLLIAGAGAPRYTKSLQQRAARAGISARTHFVGMVTGREKASLFQCAAMSVLPTHQENWGFVLIEALAAQTPVITTRGVDIWPELEATGGAIITECDTAQITGAMDRLLSDPRAARGMGERGRAAVLRWLEPESVLVQHEGMYHRAMAGESDNAGRLAPSAHSSQRGDAPRKLLRVLHYLPAIKAEVGGPARAVVDLCGGLAQRGHATTLLTSDDTDVPQPWKARSNGRAAAGQHIPALVTIPPPSLPAGLYDSSTMQSITELIRAHDVLHLHGAWGPYNVQLARAARAAGVPYFVSIRGMLDDWCMAQRRVKKLAFLKLFGTRLYERAAAVHLTARFEYEQAKQYFPNGRGVVIPNLLALEPFRELPGPQLAWRKFPWLAPPADGSKRRPMLLFLSRIHVKKGIETLLRAVKLLHERGTGCDVVIAGSGEKGYVDSLKRLASQLGLEKCAHFVGMVVDQEKLSLYQAADAFVLPTSQENFGFVFVEALACGTPVVTTKGVDIWPELENGGGSIICGATPEDVASAVAVLLADPAKAREMGERGRRWVFDWLDADNVLRQFEAMYTA